MLRHMDLLTAHGYLAAKSNEEARSPAAKPEGAPSEISVKIGTRLLEAEKQLIRARLARYRSRKKVAALLGISLKTLHNKLERFGR